MASAPLNTYKDLIDHLVDFLGAQPTGEARRDARRAAANGLRQLATAGNWFYYYQRGRLLTNGQYTTGTVAYTQSNYSVTLTGGSFPSWALYGCIQIQNIVYQVAGNPDPQTLVLAACSNPGADLAAGQSFTLYRDTYPLPADCQAIDRMILEGYAFSLWYEHPDIWLERQRIYRGPAVPRVYTVRGEPHYFGVMAVSFFPPPDAAYPFDFIYKRLPRPMVLEGYSTGSASATAGSTTITGSGTSWSSSMVGSVIRLSADSVNPPTDLVGPNPAIYEGVVLAVASASSLTADTPSPSTLGSVQYVISDPVDIEVGAMLNALLRCCEYQLALTRSRADVAQLAAQYREALILAREADSRNMALEAAGTIPRYPYRLAQMPRGPDVS